LADSRAIDAVPPEPEAALTARVQSVRKDGIRNSEQSWQAY
jgi:hypothetical protein